jgi:hypothetical protein
MVDFEMVGPLSLNGRFWPVNDRKAVRVHGALRPASRRFGFRHSCQPARDTFEPVEILFLELLGTQGGAHGIDNV